MSKKNEDNTGMLLIRLIDGEPKNINPLTEIPDAKMRLYGFYDGFKSKVFDTEEELLEYVKKYNISSDGLCIMDYLGNVAEKSDVIRLTYKDGKQKLYTSINEEGYGVYNEERSIYRGEYVWEVYKGSIREMYSAFRDRGIVFEDDTYAKIAQRNKEIYEMLKKNTKGPILTKKK